MTCARLVLVATLATLWIIGSCSAAAAEDSTQVTPSRPADAVAVPKGALNVTKVGADETEAQKKRRLRLQRKREKKERRRQKKLLRKKRRRERKLRKMQQRGMKGDDKSREGKGKKQKKKKRGKRRKKQKNKDKKKKNKRKRKNKKKKRKDKKRKKGKRRNRRRRKKKSRKRPIVPCKTDSDCEKAGSRYCCQLITGRCVRPKGGLKCFGSCMCNARKQTENFLCVTKKKKYEKFFNQKKLGKVTYEKPRGHCSNVTVSELQDPSHRYQQIV